MLYYRLLENTDASGQSRVAVTFPEHSEPSPGLALYRHQRGLVHREDDKKDICSSFAVSLLYNLCNPSGAID